MCYHCTVLPSLLGQRIGGVRLELQGPAAAVASTHFQTGSSTNSPGLCCATAFASVAWSSLFFDLKTVWVGMCVPFSIRPSIYTLYPSVVPRILSFLCQSFISISNFFSLIFF
jgi:hypothetical protein